MTRRLILVGLAAALIPLPAVAPALAQGRDWTQATATELHAAVAAGEVSAADVIRAFDTLTARDQSLNAIITWGTATALEQAEAVDAALAAGEEVGPLAGVPLVIKDNIHVAGLPNTAGTRALADFVPAEDAPVIARLRDAGAIILAKTALHELAFGISGYNPAIAGPETVGTRNPYDLERFAGGSSSGTGAAVAARMAPAGLGTDTGGSVRIPAAVNGLYGFRPSIGRYPAMGITPISATRDTAGPIARSMADIILLDQVMSGDDSPIEPADFASLRLGLVATPFLQNMDADTRRAFDAAVESLDEVGVTLVEVEIPDLVALNNAIAFPIALHEAHDGMVEYLSQHEIALSLEELAAQIVSPDVKATYEGLVIPRLLPGPDGPVPSGPIYAAAMAEGRPALLAAYEQAFATHGLDALIFPTTPTVAAPQGPEASALETFLLFIQNTDPGSNVGLPGLSVPIGLGVETGLPIGLEVDALPGADREVLAIGLALEAVFEPLPPPPMAR